MVDRDAWLIEALTRLGDSHRLAAEYGRADAALSEALELATSTLQPTRVRVSVLNALGILAKDRGDYEQAAQYYKEVLGWLTQTHGAASPKLATIHHNLAGLAFATGETGVAEHHATQAVALRRTASPPEAAALAADQSVLATVLFAQGDLDGAERAGLNALDGWIRLRGRNHYEVSVQRHILGCIYQARGHLDLAETTLKEALAGRTRTLGDGHPEVAGILNNLATVYSDMGRTNEAAQHYLTARDIYYATVGPNHVSSTVVTANLESLTGSGALTTGERASQKEARPVEGSRF
jgi:tetratricopeptide (TPR) repeat protein